MIDLHCHLLPGIDDGPDELSEALALARHAVKSGIHTAVVTPHMQAGRYENRAANIRLAVDHFAEALKAESIPLRLLPSAEVRLTVVLPGRAQSSGKIIISLMATYGYPTRGGMEA